MNSIGDEIRSKDCHEGWLMSCDPPHKGSEITPSWTTEPRYCFGYTRLVPSLQRNLK